MRTFLNLDKLKKGDMLINVDSHQMAKVVKRIDDKYLVEMNTELRLFNKQGLKQAFLNLSGVNKNTKHGKAFLQKDSYLMDCLKKVNDFTFCFIKPDVLWRGLEAEVLSDIEEHFEVLEIRPLLLHKSLAEEFYKEHKGKDFYNGLISFMTDYVIALKLHAKDKSKVSYELFRELIGPTDPEKQEAWHLRKKYALNKSQNSLHGSDSLEAAKREVALFF